MEFVTILLILLMGESLALIHEDVGILENLLISDLNHSTIQCTNLCVNSLQGNALKISGCYTNCSNDPQETTTNDRPTPIGQFLFTLDLVCKTHAVITVKVRDLPPPQDTITFGTPGLYIIEAKAEAHSLVYIAGSPTITLGDLQPHTEYKFSGFVLSRTNRVEIMLETNFSTLPADHKPQSVTNISISSYDLLHGDDLTVALTWDLPTPRGCFYQALWHADDDTSHPNRRLITITHGGPQGFSLGSLRFATRYQLAIRGRSSTQFPQEEGPLLWMDINTPSCLEWSGYDLEQCPPAPPERLNITEVDYLPLKDHYDVHVTWKAPKVNPDNYTIQLVDMDIDAEREEDKHRVYSANITAGNATSYKFSSMALYGSHFEINLVAYSPGGRSHEAFTTRSLDKLLFEKLQPTMTPNHTLWISILPPMTVLAVLILVGYSVHRCKRRKLKEFENACLYTSGAGTSYEDSYDAKVMLLGLPINDHMEVPRGNIQLLGDLGEGEFGLVKLGRLRMNLSAGQVGEQTVAIKMLKASAKPEEMLEFRKEIDMMKSVGAHKFIVSIVGHYTVNVNEMMLLTEYCPQGNLLNYLRATWRTMNSGEEIYQEIEQGTAVENKCYQMTIAPLTHADLLHMALQIASGMEYLSKNRVIHRDLAARNVLLCDDRMVKIADFGLSRDIYQNNIYRKKSKGKLPIKWMAIESLSHQIYTSQSDVWSYGILLYELVTYGSVPYASVPNENVLELLNTGFRMERPESCDEFLYDLMKACWNVVANNRPQFSFIVYQLQKMLEAEGATEMNISV